MRSVTIGVAARSAAIVCVCAALASCEALRPLTTERKVEFSEDVGNVYVTAYPAIPWTLISEKLQPQHNLSTADARNLAAVTTQAQVNQFLSLFSAGLAVSLPLRTATTTTAIAADGTSTTTGSAQKTTGAVPSASGALSSSVADTSLAPDLAKVPAAPAGIDASTLLTAGTGVYQMAKILDNQITGGVLPLGYQAHLVTLQVNLQPNGRNLPYDAFVDVTLFPGSWADAMNAASDVNTDPQALPPVVVYPLVITDAMESASVGRSLEVVRQAALQLSGIVSNAGVNLGLGGGSDRLESILGSDRNSLVTLGRVNDQTVRVRLGAQAQGSTKLAIVPRTHNLSLVVFTKATEKAYIEKLSVITRSSFVDVDTGVALESKPARRQELAKGVRKLIDSYGFTLNKSCDTADPLDGPLDFLRAADRGDYLYVGNCLIEQPDSLPKSGKSLSALSDAAKSIYERAKANFQVLSGQQPQSTSTGPTDSSGDDGASFTELSPSQETRVKRLLAGLVSLQDESRYSKFLVQLTPNKPAQLPPAQQLLLLKDDKKTSASAVIRGGKNLDAKKLSAKLHVSTKEADDVVLLPTQLTVDADSTVTVSFPSLVASQVSLREVETAGGKARPAGGAKAKSEAKDPPKLVQPRIELVYTAAIPKQSGSATTQAGQDKVLRIFGGARKKADPELSETKSATFETVKYLQADEKSTSNPVSTSSSVLVADGAGTAKLALMVGEVKAPITIRVSGADVRSIEPKADFTAKTKSFSVAGSGVVTMTLGNLSPARVVQIESLADGEPQGSAIVLTVEPARGKAAQ